MSITIPISPRRRDWFRILRDLMKAGVSMGDVGRKCGRHPKTVAEWANVSEPKESDARVVLAMYAKYCPVQYLEHQREFRILDPVIDPPIQDAEPNQGPPEG
jgi:hypothetical protein